jgi:asparagine synthase (glutamine-hydrolysing)
MCGITGIYNLQENREIPLRVLRSMTTALRHRGPDGSGYYNDESIGMGHRRLSIIDLEGGTQPLHNEDRSVWITFNGEIFNYLELRDELIKKGHVFHTHSDTEVIVHLYEEEGPDCVHSLNGQFAFGIWDRKKRELFIARDRLGIRPLFYTIVDGQLLFASEIKSLFVDPRVRRNIDLFALDQICTFWMTVPPRTAFQDVCELPAGHHMTVKNGSFRIERYWEPDFAQDPDRKTEDEYAEQLRSLLIDATKLQLRADVPVGAYLSGGLDSSVIASLIKNYSSTPLRTFSVSFTDKTYDESDHQLRMSEHLQTSHSEIHCSSGDIGRVFPDVVWHMEKPVLRTAPAPLFLLSQLVRENGYKVVLTGEGADEVLSGYDIFKEVKIRQFIQRCPGSKFRPLILKRLYPYLANSPVRSVQYAEAFFQSDPTQYPSYCSSHAPRWNTTVKTKMFFSDHLKQELKGYDPVSDLSQYLSPDLPECDPLSLAQYLEMKTLLSGYLLSSQGDRVAMAHSVEGRFPFLDHRVVEFCCKLPPKIRMKGLTEKYALRKSMRGLLPESTLWRTKQPYLAPDATSFFGDSGPEYVEDLLSERNLRKTGYFSPKAVALLHNKCKKNAVIGFKDNMAVVGIISTLLVHELFIERFSDKSSNLLSGGQEEWISRMCSLK